MGDRYASFANSGPGRGLVKRLGLPDPPRLRRYTPGDPLTEGPVLIGAAPGGRLGDQVRKVLSAAGVETVDEPLTDGRHGALIFDATGLSGPEELSHLYEFFHPTARSVHRCGRVIVLGTPPSSAGPHEATAQRALEGLTRSIGKEFGRGITSQLVHVEPGGEGALESTLRFLLSGRSAYVSGQVITIGAGSPPTPADWQQPLAGRTALVTGAARGIGAAIARVLARDGAEVIALDVPQAGDALAGVANDVRGRALQLDLTAAGAGERLASYLGGPLDIVVHNAGITRDRTIAKMDAAGWQSVLAVNLVAPERLNEALLARELIRGGGTIVGVASIAGIAGNRGQTNYATSKAGVIGLVESSAPALRERGITINAVAPGFIETAMTAKMPVALREAGRRMNSMAQGGLPVDVAETIAWFASPGSATITGNVVRVCGQSLLGA
ncbi:3-oxoacyl-ACP reductase [Paractinoplanes abujensis]|uniref:3-oxoacyl-[acyl-carrier protein] reductase n=1 Tax=Paractinoplanes abujensis TaxID=882441 RepID=A0A7W7G0B1_9ACTN|nr:3-oxoacyl-ACP reductase [Actinoplanes abujensis]MBB4691404.1 3-oxoacyl-[acyl-carrier protein] reductase [Actinoplanes abujensis]GID17183.1 3-oxoacyl-ACP reductase [Actinoplanes abujensis]